MKVEAFDRIAHNIATAGHHVYLVAQGAAPRFAYTIGLTESHGIELVFAGGALYRGGEVHQLVNELADGVRGGGSVEDDFMVGDLGHFRLVRASDAWTRRLMLGAVDYYRERRSSIRAYQILPDASHATIDIPDLTEDLASARNRPWRWIDEAWPYTIPTRSIAMTDAKILRGERATHAARWEEDQWEIFSTPPTEVEAERCRPVPIDVLLAADPTLDCVLDLVPGELVVRSSMVEPFRVPGA